MVCSKLRFIYRQLCDGISSTGFYKKRECVGEQ